MRTLVFWGDAPLVAAKTRAAGGARVVLWGHPSAEAEGDLRPPDFGPEARARTARAAERWASALGEQPGAGEHRFADLFRWNEAPLWPLCHRFLVSPESVSGRCVRLAEWFSVVFEVELPDEVEAVGLRGDEAILLERGCTARGILFQGATGTRASQAVPPRTVPGLRERVRGWRSVLGGRERKWMPGALVFVRPPESTLEVREAFERLVRVAGEEMALEPLVLGGGEEPGPEAYLDAPARAAVAEAEAAFARAFAELRGAPSTAAAFRHEGVPFADLAAEADLGVLLKQLLPQAVRRAEGVRAVLRATKARALCAAVDDALALHAARLEGIEAQPFAEAKDGPRVLLALTRAARGEGMVG